MSSYQLASLVDVINSGGRLSLSTSNGIPIPNRIILGHDTKQFTVGGSIVKTAYSGRPTLEITGNVFSGNASTYGISLGTKPSSATYIAIAESRIDCETTSGIPFILNTRLSSESNFISIILGNSYESAGSKNKINVGGGGTGASASQHLFVNGVKQASAISSNAPIQIGSIVTIGTSYASIPGASYTALAKADSSGGFAAPMRIYLFAEFPLLPETAVQRITANPGILFERKNKTYFFPSAGGGGAYTLDANSGSFALTGSNVELTVSRQIDATSGSFAFSGTNVSLEFGRVIDATSGSFALTGTNAELSVGRQIDATSGSFAITGTDVDLTYTPAGAYSLDLNSGSYALTGSTVSLEVGRQLDATSGTFSITGTDVDLARGYAFDLSSGSYSFTGTNVDLTVTRLLDATSGAFYISGTSVSLTWSGEPVDETHVTGGGGSRKMLVSERKVRDEVDEWLKKKREATLQAQIAREDDEICLIMAALAA